MDDALRARPVYPLGAPPANREALSPLLPNEGFAEAPKD